MSEQLDVPEGSNDPVIEYVGVRIAGQLFGISLPDVEDVFAPTGLTHVPLSPPEVAGLLNLRGRLVTAIDMRRRLDLGSREYSRCMVIGVRLRGVSHGFVVDTVEDVVRLRPEQLLPSPVHLNPNWRAVAAGVCRLVG